MNLEGHDMNKTFFPTRWTLAPLLAALVLAGCASAPIVEPIAPPAAPAAF
jgi:multidrug efflux system outer membrane protein